MLSIFQQTKLPRVSASNNRIHVSARSIAVVKSKALNNFKSRDTELSGISNAPFLPGNNSPHNAFSAMLNTHCGLIFVTHDYSPGSTARCGIASSNGPVTPLQIFKSENPDLPHWKDAHLSHRKPLWSEKEKNTSIHLSNIRLCCFTFWLAKQHYIHTQNCQLVKSCIVWINTPWSGIAKLYGSFVLNLRNQHCFPYWLHQFTFPPIEYENFAFLHILSNIFISGLFDNSHSNGVNHSISLWLDLHFTNN